MSQDSTAGKAPRPTTLDNGLELIVLESHDAPLVATVVWYRSGAAADGHAQGGSAHFLEHMMFKGSGAYGPGEIDRLTQALGGSNNAFTSHDSTAYYFQFAADRWEEALAIEADRMRGLTLDAEHFAAERQVIIEEIAMYESDPWDALDQRAQSALYGCHPYGRPVLGSVEELEAMDPSVLGDFHSRHYGSSNAVLVVAGDVDDSVEARVEEAFGGLVGAARPRRPPTEPGYPDSMVRVELERGEVARLLVLLPAVESAHPDHPRLRLLMHLLAVGRSSLLHRVLVEEEQLCAWVSANLTDNQEGGAVALAAEVLPSVDPERVEARIGDLVLSLADDGLDEPAVTRAKKLYEADWVFGQERTLQRALTVAVAAGRGDLELPRRYRSAVAGSSLEELRATAAHYLTTRRGVVAWTKVH